MLSLLGASLACIILQQSVIGRSARQLVESVAPPFNSQDKSEVEYRIKSKDNLDISIEGVCTNGQYWKVDKNGKIKMFLIGEIQAGGKTETELAAELADRLNEYLVDPKVEVRVIRGRT